MPSATVSCRLRNVADSSAVATGFTVDVATAMAGLVLSLAHARMK